MRSVIFLALAVAFGDAFTFHHHTNIPSPMTMLSDLKEVISSNMPNIKITRGGQSKRYSSVHTESNEWPYAQMKFDHPRQSPVDLITTKAITRNLPTLQIRAPEMKGHKAKFYNSGHTVYVYMNDDDEKIQLKGGPLMGDPFIFEQMHFHWGTEDEWGSEHMVDGESFSVEIHLVHWNSKYGSFTNASTKDDGLAVLTVFAKEVDGPANALLEPLHGLLQNVTEASSSVYMDTNDAMQWVWSAVTDNTEYYAYPGSLTTAPYSENVVFILLPKPITLSEEQLHAFRKIRNEEHEEITDNKRMLQPLHNRPIVRAKKMAVL